MANGTEIRALELGEQIAQKQNVYIVDVWYISGSTTFNIQSTYTQPMILSDLPVEEKKDSPLPVLALLPENLLVNIKLFYQ